MPASKTKSVQTHKPLYRALGVLLCCGALHSAPAFAKKAPRSAPASPEIVDKQSDLKELRERIDALRKDLASNEDSRADAADRLRESAKQIASLQSDLAQLADRKSALERRLQDLDQQSQNLQAHQQNQQQQMENLLYRQYLQGSPDSLQLLLNGENPNQVTRDLYYLAQIAHARRDLLDDMRHTLAQKKALADETNLQVAELANNEKAQEERQQALLAQKAERQKLLDELSGKIRQQRKEIGNLQRDEKNLSSLIDKLTAVLAEQEKRRRDEAARAEKLARQQEREVRTKSSGKTGEKPANVTPPVPFPTTSGEDFAREQGNLRLPAQGQIVGRFGTSREGGGTWKGLFIRANAGSQVRAMAQGRVVFADWMRGFGNLLIIDHGNGYLTVYGYNDSLLKQVGDSVRNGDAIATVGSSGGSQESGLYFELRHQGQALDPMKWIGKK
jgi:murein hydrolase activator